MFSNVGKSWVLYNGNMCFGFSNKKIINGLGMSNFTKVVEAETKLKKSIFFFNLTIEKTLSKSLAIKRMW